MILLTRKDLSFVENGCALALGTFDGLHIGHRRIIDEARVHADSLPLVVYCFSNIPAQLLRGLPQCTVRTTREKREDFEHAGIDALMMERFTLEQASKPSEDFEHFVFETLRARVVSIGFNYSYGAFARGNAETLKAAGERYGAHVYIAPPVEVRGEPASSSRLRRAVCDGNMELARELLGRPYSISGAVSHGNGIGAGFGFPTANIALPTQKQPPHFGAYITDSVIDGVHYRSITNIGSHPTVLPTAVALCETHILGFSGDIYGAHVRIEFLHFLRPEIRFESIDALKEQISKDAEAAKDYK